MDNSTVLEEVKQCFSEYIQNILSDPDIGIEVDKLQSSLLETVKNIPRLNPIQYKQKIDSHELCVYKLKSGLRKGQECGKKISPKSETRKFCGIHLKKENVYESKTVDVDNEDDVFVIRKNKFDNFVYGNTGLVFKSSKHKFIVGRQNNHTGKVEKLSDNDIDLCKKYKLRYKKE